ncbi:MAG: membrane protein insertase YidC [Lachnospiraceae bacterium]|nr:membrane protein insertase YidC [Lachnospiraceae bacterium]MDE7201039.1 membrane protein insertase YidC [Lachnospiraceae bacterium]
MNDIIGLIGDVLGWLMYFCYHILPDYFISIIIFTFGTKIVLMPVSLWVQKNSIKMVKMQPEMNFIKAKYYGNSEKISEEQYELYKREHYQPLADLIPLALQLILLMGVIDVINHPEEHIFRGKPGILDTMLGSLDLSSVPAEVGGIAYLIPLIAAFSAWFMCYIQNRINVLQSEQGKVNQLGTMILSIGLSLYLGFFVKTGVGIYWTFSNLFSVLQLYFLNIIMNPKKYIDYEALEKSREELKAASAFGRQNKKKLFEKDPYRKKEKADYKRFFKDYEMQLVFYSEKNGFYKYFQNIIETLLEKSDVVINYITSDPNDKVFEMESDRFKPYYIGENKLIVLMMKMEADIVVMTTPDLESFHIKRSLVRKDNEYIYVPHDVNSVNMAFRKEALDHFDTIFSSGVLCTKEIRKREELYKLPPKRIIEWGSSVIDNMIQAYSAMNKSTKRVKKVLIAPSWQKDNILSSCIEEILANLQGHGYKIIVRPHPQFVRHEEARLTYLRQKFNIDTRDDMELQTDFSSNKTVYEADILITDWSSIAFEYSFATLKPSLYINTPMKILNEDYQELGITPIDIELRSVVGRSVDMDKLDTLPQIVEELLHSNAFSTEALEKIRNKYIYNIGSSGEVGAQYIMERLAYFKELHEAEEEE